MANSLLAVSRTGTGFDTSRFESRPDTYALLLSSTSDAVISVGRLGDLACFPKDYIPDGYPLCASSICILSPLASTRMAFPSITMKRNRYTKVRADEPNRPEFIKVNID